MTVVGVVLPLDPPDMFVQQLEQLNVRDSKKLTQDRCLKLHQKIEDAGAAWIGTRQIYPRSSGAYATVTRAIQSIYYEILEELPPAMVIIDGAARTDCPVKHASVIGGDDYSLTIACASIIARALHIKAMYALDEKYPGYEFSKNQGYGTKQHMEALRTRGPCNAHRHELAVVQRATRHQKVRP